MTALVTCRLQPIQAHITISCLHTTNNCTRRFYMTWSVNARSCLQEIDLWNRTEPDTGCVHLLACS